MSFPRPGRFFSRNASKQLPRLRQLRDTISNLSGGSRTGENPIVTEGQEAQQHGIGSPAQNNLPGATDSTRSARKQSVTVHKGHALPGNSFFSID
jgi:hypothetical protein